MLCLSEVLHQFADYIYNWHALHVLTNNFQCKEFLEYLSFSF